MHHRSYYLVNTITVYRIIAAPVLIVLILTGNVDWFKWLLAVSFFTDAVDGYLARRFNAISILGAKLDSIGDDLTIAAAITGLFVLKLSFIKAELAIVITLLALYLIQVIYALMKYHKITGFHTYFAKAAAVLQGAFLILIFLLPSPVYILFYAAAIATIVDLVEEIILVYFLPTWEANVKGLYWVMKRKSK